MTTEASSIVELAEAIKEIVRILQCAPGFEELDPLLKRRLENVYLKSVRAKDRMNTHPESEGTHVYLHVATD
jgi:hypothetical protein